MVRPDFRKIIFATLVSLAIFWLVLFWYLRDPNFISGNQLPDAGANATALETHVRALSDPKINRSYTHDTAMKATADYIENNLQTHYYQVRRQQVLGEGHVSYNLIVRYGDPGAKEIMVVGAHYDAAGETNPGADDNASGVAGLLELAKILDEKQPRTPVPIEMVFYTLEEPPFFGTKDMGSSYHADELKENAVQVKLMLALEMIGYFSDDLGSQKFPMPLLYLIYPWTGNFIALVGSPAERSVQAEARRHMNANSNIPVYGINAPSFIQGTDFSDHRNYWVHDWPALMVTDTAFLRNQQYHQSGDTADRLDYKKMAQVVAAGGLAFTLFFDYKS